MVGGKAPKMKRADLAAVAARCFHRFMRRRDGRVSMQELYMEGALCGAKYVIRTFKLPQKAKLK